MKTRENPDPKYSARWDERMRERRLRVELQPVYASASQGSPGERGGSEGEVSLPEMLVVISVRAV